MFEAEEERPDVLVWFGAYLLQQSRDENALALLRSAAFFGGPDYPEVPPLGGHVLPSPQYSPCSQAFLIFGHAVLQTRPPSQLEVRCIAMQFLVPRF